MYRLVWLVLVLATYVSCRVSVKRELTGNNCIDEGRSPGEHYRVPPCSSCHCNANGDEECYRMMCLIYCPNGRIHREEGQCCGRCIAECEHDGRTYKFGERYKKDRCTECECGRGGQEICMSPSCMMPFDCPNGTHHPEDQCCPSCA